jgi:hypothetical protein
MSKEEFRAILITLYFQRKAGYPDEFEEYFSKLIEKPNVI